MKVPHVDLVKEKLGQDALDALQVIYHSSTGEPPSVPAMRFRADHYQWLDILVALDQSHSLIERDRSGTQYRLRSYALPLIAEAYPVLDRMQTIYARLRKLYAEHLGEPMSIGILLDGLEGKRDELLTALYYLSEMHNVWSGKTNNFPYDDDAALVISESVLRSESIAQVLSQYYQWHYVNPEQISAPGTRQIEENFVMEPTDLEAEIYRVQTTILEVLRNNAYRGQKRTSIADVAKAVGTTDAIFDRSLSFLEHCRFIVGALGGQMKITPEGEVELSNRRAGEPTAGHANEPQRTVDQRHSYDVFISHASEDKAFVRPLADALTKAGLNVWYDEFTLKLGDSLRSSIDRGLAKSRFGVIVLSHQFFQKEWPQKELSGLYALMQPGEKKLLPIWHEIKREELVKYSPTVADLLGIRSNVGIDKIVEKILEVVNG